MSTMHLPWRGAESSLDDSPYHTMSSTDADDNHDDVESLIEHHNNVEVPAGDKEGGGSVHSGIPGQQHSLQTSTGTIWNGNFFCVMPGRSSILGCNLTNWQSTIWWRWYPFMDLSGQATNLTLKWYPSYEEEMFILQCGSMPFCDFKSCIMTPAPNLQVSKLVQFSTVPTMFVWEHLSALVYQNTYRVWWWIHLQRRSCHLQQQLLWLDRNVSALTTNLVEPSERKCIGSNVPAETIFKQHQVGEVYCVPSMSIDGRGLQIVTHTLYIWLGWNACNA